MSVKKLKRFSHNEGFDSNLFTCINYKDKTISPDTQVKPYIQIAAFDPGIINTGCRIERRLKDLNGNIVTITVRQILLKSAQKESTDHYFITMRNHLLSMARDLYECDYILIESQMRNNPEAIRMSQHIISTLLGITEGSDVIIVEILPTVKSRSFGIKGLKGKDLKKRAVVEALKILEERGDIKGESMIKETKKKDDHADVILYCDAWYRYLQTNNFSP